MTAKKVLVILAHGAEEMETVISVDILCLAEEDSRRPEVGVHIPAYFCPAEDKRRGSGRQQGGLRDAGGS